MHEDTYDVAVIGYGPVGMAMAALLGGRGHRVVVLERYSGKYNLPRAATFDDETMRTFALLGVADELLPKLRVQSTYEWRNADGALLIEHQFNPVGPSGWAEWYMMYQPDLEDALDAACQRLEQVEVRFGARVEAFSQTEDGVELRIEASDDPVRARYVVACDGGNSFVRETLGIAVTDYGFSEPWLVCDFRMRRDVDIPMAQQICNPAQPTAIVSIGLAHHRFSFMLDSEGEAELERQPDRVWARVSPYLSREDADLIRAATYVFRSRIATRWRDGRILLAGDAAHQMPPFLGQGMCSGIRDALNLSFKLDLALTGRCDPRILDSYQVEREPHVRAVTMKGIELGRVQTTRDPKVAARRDEALLAQRRSNDAPQKLVFPPLSGGMLSDTPAAGELFVQGRVRTRNGEGLFDAVVGYGYLVLIDARLKGELKLPTGEDHRACDVRVAFVSLAEQTDDIVEDIDGTYAAWLREHACDAVAVRPDFRVWGTAVGADGASRLVEQFTAEFATGR